jgi:hypothetical protein
MKFEVRETVKNQDPEVVLRALEMCSREVSSDVVRQGDRITVRGLGPSPRSKNKHDITVFRVDVENGETVIQGEVNFQASALLGNTSQQDVVRLKLNDLFEQMRAQIQLDTLRVATYAAARKSAAGTAVIDRSEGPDVDERRASKPSEEKMAPVTPETLTEAMTAAPDSGWGAAALVAEPHAENIPSNSKDEPERVIASYKTLESEPSADAEHTVAPEQRAQPRFYGEPELPEEEPTWQARTAPKSSDEPERVIASKKTFESGPSADAEHADAPEQRAQPRFYGEPELPEEEPTWQARTAPYRLRIEDHRMSGGKRFALWTMALLALLAAAGGGYFYWSHGEFYWLHRETAASPTSAAARAVGVAANPVPKLDTRKAEETSPAKPAPLPESTPESATSGANVSATSSADLKLWLQSWAASMRTKDANAQAAFYADTLDRYLNQRNVSREAVLRDREATIRMRKGLWTVKMADIVIERQTESEADVSLVKHFTDEQQTSEILESFVPTLLKLKRLNGQWRITSEQDLPSL